MIELAQQSFEFGEAVEVHFHVAFLIALRQDDFGRRAARSPPASVPLTPGRLGGYSFPRGWAIVCGAS